MGHALVVEDDAAVRRALLSVLVGRMPDCVIDTATTRRGGDEQAHRWALVAPRRHVSRAVEGRPRPKHGRRRGAARGQGAGDPRAGGIMTGALDVADALNPQALGVIGVLKKPFSMNELVDILAHVAAGATPTKFLFAVIDRPSLNLSRNALHDLGTLPMHQLE